MRTSVPGVATGLAWTPTGGDILFVEAARVPGNGRLILTGQLGDVMKESAQAALSLVKARASTLGVDPATFEKSDIHVHVPAGAIPKDGPSAGVAMFIALTSLLTGRTVRSDTAMTGEISLRGLVLPIGGVKNKVLAAVRAGITTVHAARAQQEGLRGRAGGGAQCRALRLGLHCRRRHRGGARAASAADDDRGGRPAPRRQRLMLKRGRETPSSPD